MNTVAYRMGLFASILTCALSFVPPTLASEPVAVVVTACVVDSELVTEETDFGKHSSAGRYRLITFRQGERVKLDLSSFEGRRIRASGYLLPGDVFYADPASLRDLGPCREAAD